MPACEMVPLLLCADGFLVGKAGAVLGGLLRRFSRSSRSAVPIRRPAYNPAERFLPCHRLSVTIPRA